MKADKNTLLAIKKFLKDDSLWDKKELISDMVVKTNLLKHKDMGDYTLSLDECEIIWDEDSQICLLEDFVDSYTDIFIDKICNVLKSFENDDLNNYLEEDL